MRGRVIRRALRHRLGAAAVVAGMSMALSACGSVSQIASPFGSGGVFGSSKPARGGWTATVTEETMLTAARGGGDVAGATGGGCPTFGLASRAEAFITVKAAGGAPGDNLSAVKHRGEITKTARECAAGPRGVIVKYGFAGRVLLGPKGRAGVVTLPVKVKVVDGGRKTVKTEPLRVPVTIGAGEAVGYFSVVREIVVPVAPGAGAQSYKVYVAFDRSAAGAG